MASGLRVVNATGSDAQTQALRARWLTTAQYGTRLHAQTLKQTDHLPYPSFMASCIAVVGPHARIPGRKLARVLRPCGGMVVVSGLPSTEVETIVRDVCAALAEAGSTGDTVRTEGDLVAVVGHRPESFGFAMTLNDHDGNAQDPIRRRHLFGDEAAEGINNGWATVFLSGQVNGELPAPHTVVTGTLKEMPKERAGPRWAKEMDPAIRQQPRLHPLTAEPGPRIFRTGSNCGRFDFSASCVIKRSGASKVFGIYDFADDSGLRSFNGVSAACNPSSVSAMGLLINSEGRSRCVCSYPYRTTVVFAPAERRLNEDVRNSTDHLCNRVARGGGSVG
jgi:hypothetical protein